MDVVPKHVLRGHDGRDQLKIGSVWECVYRPFY